MSKLDQLKTMLKAKGLWAKKSLGQNFLVDDVVLRAIVNAANLSDADHVLEVGPGTGFLTEQLIQNAAQVTSIELDPDMVNLLNEQFKLTPNLTVIEGDVLKLSISDYRLANKPYKVVANIPYYITSPVIRHFLKADERPTLMVLLVQKEVAEKICSMGGRTYLTMETAVFGRAEYVTTVPSMSFYPAPKVDSAVLKINVYPEPLIPAEKHRDFLRLIKFGYSQKRKKLANSLGAGLHKKPKIIREYLAQAQIDPNCRAEDLEIEDWKRLLEHVEATDS